MVQPTVQQKYQNKRLLILIDKHLPKDNKLNKIFRASPACTSTSLKPHKVYFGTTEEEFQQRFYNHKKSFNNNTYRNDTTLSKYLWDIKEKYKEILLLKWDIVRIVPSY